MECNKEEAIRARDIAECKMKNNDFVGARKFLLKALQLSRDLENISQMIMVCDVHCSAEKKLFGNEMDWYGILQIEQTVDEATIKKQYKKFALQLHPDKNKFPGAETAFKMIGEAQRVLLDPSKRPLHDMRRRPTINRPAPPPRQPYQPPQKPAWYPNVGGNNYIRRNFTQHQRPQQPVQPVNVSAIQTFWTMCPFCSVRYQYYRSVINRSIICQTCSKPFVAYERNEQGVPMTANLHQPAFCPQKEVPCQGAFKAEQVFKGNFTADRSKTAFSQKSGCPPGEVGKKKVNGKRRRKQVVESSESFDSESSNDSEVGRKQVSESIESVDSESSSDSEVDMTMDENGDFEGGKNSGRYRDHYPRRSSRSKQHVSYIESESDDDNLVSRPKRAKGSGSSCDTEEGSGDGLKEAPKTEKPSISASSVKEEQKAHKISASFDKGLPNGNKKTGKVNGKEKVEEDGCQKTSGAHADGLEQSVETVDDSTSNSNSDSELDPEHYDYPDPDFHDFDMDRKEEHFKVEQIWAVYDTLDAMPRFYARIIKIFPSGFKLRITWLEPDPDDKNEIKWVNNGLPVCCGKYKLGNSEYTEDRLMFSHLVSWEKGRQRDTYKVFPKKGETWALFKDWDFNWNSEPDTKKQFEFEFVEILSDYVEGVGVSVANLVKVKGFASVFCRSKEEPVSFHIQPGEIFRFSHRIPSITLSGEEREGVLKGSFELDPFSLPHKLEEIALPKIVKAEAGVTISNCSLGSSNEQRSAMWLKEQISLHQAEVKEIRVEHENDNLADDIEDCSAPPALNPKEIEIPEPEFYDFDADKLEDKLQVGQIWSMYSDEDGLPKYYGEIVKIESDPVLELHMRWLVSYSLPNNCIRWHDGDMPICCGRFKIEMGEVQKYDTTCLSHQVKAERAGKKNEYTIFPRKGEVWALYKDWNAKINCSCLENCEYDIVEIQKASDTQMEVLFLERVDGFTSVFRPQVRGASAMTMDIPMIELLRFSHQIPVFRLTDERDGSLRGFWELDPAALPVQYLLS
ncbi:uncharacterized protein LOC123221193 [Mangifera indica]|uniref:uncharacterized protein LOC123221193 n=1 Tax=Mangifera indica TaxID=29780 RepID=UPI001CFC3451|nr:uncharacterized protein LOC123221193 [Mangifera indica]XP_044499889.1 uncharacterized protein LOC123221193 [Mangifera indica]